jgi:hypothetical protein
MFVPMCFRKRRYLFIAFSLVNVIFLTLNITGAILVKYEPCTQVPNIVLARVIVNELLFVFTSFGLCYCIIKVSCCLLHTIVGCLFQNFDENAYPLGTFLTLRNLPHPIFFYTPLLTMCFFPRIWSAICMSLFCSSTLFYLPLPNYFRSNFICPL